MMIAHPELAEHVATYAAERGDTELEQLCDDVLAGLTEEALLLAVVSGDPDLQEAVERGRNSGWRSRRGVQDAFERATLAITGRPYAEIATETAPVPTSYLAHRALGWEWDMNRHERVIGEHSYAQEYMQQPAPLVATDPETETGRTPSSIGSRFASIAPPPGIYRMREQAYRISYNRERRMAVDVDGVSWPVDLGESG